MPKDGDSLEQWLVLSLENREYALPVQSVVEVLRMVALTPMPDAPVWIAGLLNLRGNGVVVMDLRRRLGLPGRAADPSAQIVVLQTHGEPIGLIADDVVEIVALSNDALKPADRIIGASPLIAAVAQAGERLMLILDLARLDEGRARAEATGVAHAGA